EIHVHRRVLMHVVHVASVPRPNHSYGHLLILPPDRPDSECPPRGQRGGRVDSRCWPPSASPHVPPRAPPQPEPLPRHKARLQLPQGLPAARAGRPTAAPSPTRVWSPTRRSPSPESSRPTESMTSCCSRFRGRNSAPR